MGRKSNPKDRKKNEEKKRLWAQQAFAFFQLGGLAELTIDGIAKWLGKSKSTLYEYFESKEEILALSLLTRLEVLQGYQAILNDTNNSFIARYKLFLEFILPHVADVSSQFLYDLKIHFPNIWAIIELFSNELVADLDIYHRGGITAGEFKPLSVLLMVKMDSLFISGVLMEPAFLMEHRLSLRELVEQYILLKFEGLRVVVPAELHGVVVPTELHRV